MERRLRQIAGLENRQSSPRLNDVACESIPPIELLLDTNASPTTVVSTDDSQVTVICCAPTEVIENTTDMDKRLADQLNNSQVDNQFIHLCEISTGCKQSGPYTKLFDWEFCCQVTEDSDTNHVILEPPEYNKTLAHSMCAASEELLNKLKGLRTWCA
ncbi:hypothetical protein PHET_10256 [Paragonimus heterotremus]|uniref:Uncharacterized protein n=1 Tax=Paragonimus heterotremus TaxID=100268 RepID=A0A8J4WCU1_9TREM|nr:hypothetical protein PHET_10256 [Paragonimus heterotremus]